MLKIDNDLLVELGLGNLPDGDKNSLLRHIYETLEMRVGMRLADQMSNEQLDEFEKYFEAKDDAGAFKWLETNFPNYKDIVQQEFDKLKAEVGQAAPQILAGAQAQPQAAAPAPVSGPAPTAPPVAPAAPPASAAAAPVPPAAPAPAAFDPASAPAPAQPYAAPAPAPAPQSDQMTPPAYPQYPPAPSTEPPVAPQYPPTQPPAGPTQQ
jgi:hypothetical protein